jgi:hypothetical protein
MKSQCRAVLVALVGMLALSAFASASASATLPDFHPEGTKISPVNFTVAGGKMNFPVGGFLLSCAQSTGTGSITGAKTGTAKLTLEECRGPLGETCQSGSHSKGIIVTESLPIVLVYTTKEPTKQVAIDFGSQASTFMTYNCGGVTVTRGRILAPITPLDTLTKTFTAKLSEVKGRQTPTENYNEALTGKEESFPEVSWNGGAFHEEEALTGNLTLTGFQRGGKAIEEKIEA